MRRGRRLLQSLIVSLLTLMVLMNSGLFGPAPIGMASAQTIARAQAAQSAQGDKGRFVPQPRGQHSVTTWHPDSSPNYPTLKSSNGNSSSVVQKRTPGEQADMRTAASSTYLNADGTWTLKSYNVPIHYKDAQGHWQNIDASIVSDTSDPGYAFGNKANSWHVHFANQAGGPAVMHLQQPGLTLMDTLQGAAAVRASTSGNEIIYGSVFPNVDLRYWLGMSHVEELLLLQSAQTPASYIFNYHIPGASARQDASGAIVVTDAKGHLLAAIGGIQMYEANAHGDMLPKGAGTSAVQVALSGSGPDFSVTLTPDKSWLADRARTFPVAIDPTLNLLGGADQGLAGGVTNGNIYGDTFVESGNPGTNNANWSFYDVNTERIGDANNMPTTATGYGTGVDRTYIKFPVGSAPSHVRVTSATMQLYQLSSWSGGTTINAKEVSQAWDETQVTWNAQPSTVNVLGSGNSKNTYNVSMTIDVTAIAYDWWQNNKTNNGIQLLYASESVAADLFASDDRGSNLPSLAINYVQDTTLPGGGVTITNATCPTQNGQPAYCTNNPNLSLSTSPSDAGATNVWSSNWSTVNGVSGNGGTAASWSVDAAHTQLTATTASCGGCAVETFFTNTVSTMSNWPTFTAMFKADLGTPFNFGVVASGSNSTRFDLVAPANGTAFNTLEYSTAGGSYHTTSETVPISANTWYYGQVSFPLSNVGEIYIWPVGQARPATPTVSATGIYMSNPGLNFWIQGSSTNLHSYTIGNVFITQKDTASGTIGYGVSQAEFSNDNSTWSCPSPGSGAWCVAAQQQTTPWTLTSGDGAKTVYVNYYDNAGNPPGTSSISIHLDTTPPTTSITSPANGREVRGWSTVTVSATDAIAGVANIGLYVDNVATGNALQGTSAPTFTWDTTAFAPGMHTLTVRATDNAGNTATSAGVNVIVSNPGQMSYETYAMRSLPDGTSAGVNTANGNAEVEHQDLVVPGRGPNLAIGRTYNAQQPANRLFGWGWTSDLDEGLTPNADGSVTYLDSTGGTHVFLPNGSSYITPPGLHVTLAQNPDGTYTLTAADQSTTTFNSGGYITSVKDRNGNTLTVAYSSGLTPTTVTDAAGRTLTITMANGHVTGIAVPGSRTYAYAYDANGNLTDYTDPANVVAHYTYDSGHHLLTITANYVSGGATDSQTNVKTVLTYDSFNWLSTLTDPMSYDVGITYIDPSVDSGSNVVGNQTKVYQLQTNSTTTPATINSQYEVTTYQATTDSSGAIYKITDPAGSTQYAYDTNENVTTVQDPLGNVNSNTYDTSSNPLTNGNQLTHVVDPGSTPHLNLTTSYTYDTGNNVATATNPQGMVTQYTYDTPTTGNLTKVINNYVSGGVTDSQTNVTSTATYDSSGEVVTATDPLGVVTLYAYDTQGDTTSVTKNYVSGGPSDNQTNLVSSATYDTLGQKLTSTDELGVVTQYTDDIRGLLMQVVKNYVAGGPHDSQTNITSSYTYDALGRQVTTTDPLGVVTKSDYDADGRVTQTTKNYVSGGPSDSQTNVVTKTAYDAAGNATLVTDPVGNTTTTTFDAANRGTEVKQNASAANGGALVSDKKATYDPAGHTLTSQVVDGTNTLTTSYTYDKAGRTATVSAPPANPGATDASGQSNVTNYTYDTLGRVTDSKVTNSQVTGAVSDTAAQYDTLGKTTSKTEQNGTSTAQTTTFTYDKAGRQATQTDSTGTTRVDRDAIGRPVTTWHPDNSTDTSSYDKASHTLTSSNGTTTTTYVYDAQGRISQEQVKDTATGAVQQTTSYAYDANGQSLNPVTTYANGTVSGVTYTYDKLGHIQTMNDGTRSFTYDLNGNLKTMQVLNGTSTAVEEDFTYDGGNRPMSMTDKIGPSGSILHNYNYSYDGRGNGAQISVDGTVTKYVYDDSNQLTQVTDANNVLLTKYTYDANHNRTSMVTGSSTTNYSYDTSNTELTQKVDPNGKVTTYTYDSAGSLSTATYDPTGANQQTTYHYSSFAGKNLLSEIDKPDGSKVQFSYDADGNRVSKTVITGGAFPTTTKVIDVYQAGRIAYETDGANTTLATFTYSPNGTPTSVTVGSNPSTDPRYYYVYNPHGDVVALVDGGGTTVATYSYNEYGTPTIWESFTNGWHNPYLYDGLEGVRYDSETSLYWMSVRAYDPSLGRFISHDPLGRAPLFFDASQPYAYGGNNPLRNTDPSGQMPGGAFVEGSAFWTPSMAPSRVQQLLSRVEPTKPGDGCSNPAHCRGVGAFARFNSLAPLIVAAGATLGSGIHLVLDAVKIWNEMGPRASWGALLKEFEDDVDAILALISFLGNLTTLLSEAFHWNLSGVMQWLLAATSFATLVGGFIKKAKTGISMVWYALAEGWTAIAMAFSKGAAITVPGLIVGYVVPMFLRALFVQTAAYMGAELEDAIVTGTNAYIQHVESLGPDGICTDWSTGLIRGQIGC